MTQTESVRQRNRSGRAGAKQKKAKTRTYMDYGIVFIVVFLCCFGLIMIYSITQYTLAMNDMTPTVYLRKQAWSLAGGIIAMVAAMLISYRFIQKVSFIIYMFSICLIPLVLTPLGRGEINGASRWLNLGGVSVQPSEIVKTAVIIYGAFIINKYKHLLESLIGTILISLVAVVPALLIFVITKNMSSAIVIIGVFFLMMFVASKKTWYYVLAAGGLVGVAATVVHMVNTRKIDPSSSFRFARITAWLDPYADSSGGGYQILQSLYSIGSGGIFGKGLGHSIQKGLIPEAQNDMIFAIICEELGVFTGIAIILMFIILVWRMLIIAKNADDLYGSILVVGVMSHIALQVVINVAVVTNTIPNTGIPLPFISYGGTSLLMFLVEVGLVLSVARRIPCENQE
ncbi:MAG: putative lipid II flippase FtsW [Lachnospiraceae bacterium]|nr:putative lipid II flippase FtsW [Lachnospiraceae bacterium]